MGYISFTAGSESGKRTTMEGASLSSTAASAPLMNRPCSSMAAATNASKTTGARFRRAATPAEMMPDSSCEEAMRRVSVSLRPAIRLRITCVLLCLFTVLG